MTSAISTLISKSTDSRPWRLVMCHSVFESAVRLLWRTPRAWAVGQLRPHSTHSSRELIVDQLSVVTECPVGTERTPLADWFVLSISDEPMTLDDQAPYWPTAQQFLATLQLKRVNTGEWAAAVWRNDRMEWIDEVWLPGRRGLILDHRDHPTDSPTDRLRNSRTIGVVEEQVFRRLSRATVTLIGAGRNGSQLAFQLAALNIHRLRLIDPDILSVENLNAAPGLSANSVGQSKVRALGRALRRYRPDLLVSCVNRPVSDGSVRRLIEERCDLLVTAVDDDLPRLAATLAANQTLTVHLDVGSSIQRGPGPTGITMTADARLLLPGAGCCCCVGGIARLDDVTQDLQARPGSLPRRIRPAWNRVRAGSLVTLNALAVSSGVQLWLDLLGGSLASSFWQRLEWKPGAGMISQGARVEGNSECQYCRRK